jgi:hypothetical protein
MRNLLRSPEVLRDLERRAERVTQAAGPGHRTDSDVGDNRARAAVITATYDARRGQARHKTLLRALDAAR